MMPTFVKDPQAMLDYQVDWSSWLAVGETITVSAWTGTTGLTVGSGAQAPSHTTTSATIWLSGGTLGQTYLVVNEITTSAGRVDDRTIGIVVRDQ